MKSLMLLFILTILLSGYILNRYCSISRFGIETSKYEDLVEKQARYYTYNHNTNRISWNSSLKLPNSAHMIKVEHLFVLYELEKKIFKELPDKRCLGTYISFDPGAIKSIMVGLNSDNKKLKYISTYLHFHSEEDAFNGSWSFKKIDKNQDLSEFPGATGFVVIYESPNQWPEIIFRLFRSFMFQNIHQEISIEYFDYSSEVASKKYKFDLIWFEFISGFMRLVTIT
jgi:hypothetical protein